MTPGRFQRIRDLVLEARELAADARAELLERACAGDEELRREVQALLAHDSGDEGLLRSGGLLARVGAALPREVAAEAMPEHVGPYRIVRLLGEGGMGRVFLARQLEPIQREVALKLVHQGLDSQRVLARFDLERRSLGRMDHPGIARVLDAGSDESGRPYFVMEHVAGEPLTDFADRHGLGVRARLDLLLRVCSAVHHAHQRGILHRDLKPSNILVALQDAVPTPKIIDFGIAKALEDSTDPSGGSGMTQEGQWLGTPDYMSPEQAGLVDATVDTRSDVYALGIILYELLAGSRPETPARAFLRRGVRPETDDVVRPSEALRAPGAIASSETTPKRSRREIAGDLDTIVLHALRTEPARRYPSVEHLADDLRRHLSGRPVLARPDTWRYRAGKFVKRHRLPLSLAAAAVIALAGFAVMSVRQSARLAIERDRAREAEQAARLEATTSRQVSDFLVDLFEHADPNVSRGAQLTARELLDRGAARVDSGLADQPEVRARLLHTVGSVYQGLALYESARASLEKALQLRRAALGDSAADVAATLDALGALAHDEGRLEDSERLEREALAIWRRVVPPNPEGLVASLSNLATTLQARGNFAEAGALKREALELGRTTYGPDHGEVGFLLYSLGYLEHRLGRIAAAESLYVAALAIQRRKLGPKHPDVAGTINNLAAARRDLGDVAGSEPLWREALDLYVALYGPEHPAVARGKANLASSLLELGRATEARDLYEEARALNARTIGTQHRNYATPLLGLGRAELALGNAARAEAHFRHALDLRRKTLGPEGPGVGSTLTLLASAVKQRGDRREAENLLRESLRIQRAHLPPAHPEIADCLVALGELLAQTGRAGEARPLLEEAVGIRRSALPAGHPAIAQAEAALAAARRTGGAG